MTYQPGGTCDADVFRRELEVRRERDRQRGTASFGPHRDELLAQLNGRPARSHASQGQQRLLSLALKLAEHRCIREVTGMEPVLLLDDVSSELDPERTDAVFAFLRAARSQIFVTTTRPELFESVHLGLASESPAEELRADFIVIDGQLQRARK